VPEEFGIPSYIAMLVWHIHPLPDFLADHTLTGNSGAEKLVEVVSRWVQWVGNFWSWHDRATFAVRFMSHGGGVKIFLLAQSHEAENEEILAGEVGVLLRTYRLGSGEPLRLLAVEAVNRTWDLPNAAILEVRQHETRSLWRLRHSLLNSEQFRQQFNWLPQVERDQPRVVYPWWGPGGPFLVPMESLISQPVPVTLTIYLEPTQLQQREWHWLATMASEAQSQGEQTIQQLGSGAGMRAVDPSANLAGKLYIANLRRLSANPFLVTVHAAAADGRFDVAGSLAGAMQSLVQEQPLDRQQQNEERLPSGAAVIRAPEDESGEYHRQVVAYQYHNLRFARPHPDDPLIRLSYLTDARGAATAFRLPVSVRGGVPGIKVRQLPPDFHPGPRQEERPADHIELGLYQGGGRAFMPLRDLCKHALVTGFTGSGKTVTVLQLLHQIWADHQVPFLVLESAKQEYRGLLGVDEFANDLRVFTLGNELCVPLRLNPFELLPEVRVEAHVSKLQTCFEGAIPPIGPSSSVIAEGLLRVYAEQGWSLTDVYPASGRSKRRFPKLSDFVRIIEQVLEERGYEGEVQSNLKAALVGRFKPLLIGGKGRMFDTRRSRPSPVELFRRPAVLEMNDLSVDDKALVAMFVLTLLREYRERNRSRGGELIHVTMVEEAHNLLENVASKGGGEGATSADTRFKAVEAFCQMLTEIRSLGEGLIIADQSPEKLARDAMRNTNLQIAHQLRDSHDREAIASAMIMEKEQRDFLGKLLPGQAAVFRTGLEKATFIQVDKYYPTGEDWAKLANIDRTQAALHLKKQYRGVGFDQNLTDDALAAKIARLDPSFSGGELDLPFQGCTFCQTQCIFRDSVFSTTAAAEFEDTQAAWLEKFNDETGTSKEDLRKWTVTQAIESLAANGNGDANSHSIWCWFVHLWDRQFSTEKGNQFLLDADVYADMSLEAQQQLAAAASE
jgi:hypothetical protein